MPLQCRYSIVSLQLHWIFPRKILFLITLHTTTHLHIPILSYFVLFTASYVGIQGMPGALSDRIQHLIGFLCEACGKKIASSIAFDRHRQYGYLRGTACYVLNDGSTRRQLVATKRVHRSSASLEKKSRLCLESEVQGTHIFYIRYRCYVYDIYDIPGNSRGVLREPFGICYIL